MKLFFCSIFNTLLCSQTFVASDCNHNHQKCFEYYQDCIIIYSLSESFLSFEFHPVILKFNSNLQCAKPNATHGCSHQNANNVRLYLRQHSAANPKPRSLTIVKDRLDRRSKVNGTEPRITTNRRKSE